MKFIELTDSDNGEKVWVNPHKITTLSRTGDNGGTRIVFGSVRDPNLFVKESVKTVLAALSDIPEC